MKKNARKKLHREIATLSRILVGGKIMEIRHTITDNGEPVFCLLGVDRETLCLLLNATYENRNMYADAFSKMKKGGQVAGRTDSREISTYLATLSDYAYTLTNALRKADEDAEEVIDREPMDKYEWAERSLSV